MTNSTLSFQITCWSLSSGETTKTEFAVGLFLTLCNIHDNILFLLEKKRCISILAGSHRGAIRHEAESEEKMGKMKY